MSTFAQLSYANKKSRMKNCAHVRRAINFTSTFPLWLLLFLFLLFFLSLSEEKPNLMQCASWQNMCALTFQNLQSSISHWNYFSVRTFCTFYTFIMRMLKIIIANCFSSHKNNIHFILFRWVCGNGEKELGKKQKITLFVSNLSAFTPDHIIHRPRTNDLIEYKCVCV